MIHDPDTHYARTADGAHLAFQVVGDGPHDLILMLNTIPIDSVWEDPDLGGAVDSLARSARVVLFDARGAGASDALPQGRLLAVEEAMSDIAAVMDAAGSARAFLFKTDNIAPVVMFATTWPERVGGIVMLNAYARLGYAPDYPMGIPKEQLSLFVEVAQTGEAGADAAFRAWCRPRMNDERLRRWFRKAYRRTAAPGALVPLILQDFETDARHVLPLVQVPTLVLHCADDPYILAWHGRYLAKHITGARYAELPGDAHSLASVDLDPLVDEVSEFVTGAPTRPRVDRVFATVLFTDIVDSTAHAVRMGDARWKALLDEHDALAQRQTSRFGGRLIKSTGDGVVATFDGPARAVSCALAIRDGLRRLDIDVRIGIHAGEVEARGDDVSGISVHLASRVQAKAAAGQILTTRTVVDLVAGSGLAFDSLEEVELKGVPGEWRLYAVRG